MELNTYTTQASSLFLFLALTFIFNFAGTTQAQELINTYNDKESFALLAKDFEIQAKKIDFEIEQLEKGAKAVKFLRDCRVACKAQVRLECKTEYDACMALILPAAAGCGGVGATLGSIAGPKGTALGGTAGAVTCGLTQWYRCSAKWNGCISSKRRFWSCVNTCTTYQQNRNSNQKRANSQDSGE